MIEEGFITEVEFPERPLPQPVGLLVAFTIVIRRKRERQKERETERDRRREGEREKERERDMYEQLLILDFETLYPLLSLTVVVER